MTEAEWAVCTVPHKMLRLIVPNTRYRKMRLFACACVRRLWRQWEPRSWSVQAVETAERFADGTAKRPELRAAAAAAVNWSQRDDDRHVQEAAHCAALLPEDVPDDMFSYWTDPLAERAEAAGLSPAVQCDLLREIFGRTWNKLPAADRAWLKWNDGAVRKMARSIYDGRDYDCLPLLADALEEAGCTDAAILAHCRGPGEHVRGCWCLDLLIGRV